MSYQVAAFYRFISWPDYADYQGQILGHMRTLGVKGTILLANEGVNGTIAASPEAMTSFITWLKTFKGLDALTVKYAKASRQPFLRAKVKLKQEIVTMGVKGLDPQHATGRYVSPEEWNSLISDPSVTVVDTRNDYEVAIGSFKGSINPNTKTFREFPDYVKRQLDPCKHKRVAMFCTGGIRCEKSTAYLKELGFEEVYHLQGGILKYLEETPPEDSLWQGQCFVFDGRVAVDHHLQAGTYEQCHACRHPITEEEKALPSYEPGVSCCHCVAEVSDEQRKRFAERQKQLTLADARGESHLGDMASTVAAQRQRAKHEAKARQRQHNMTSPVR